MSPVKWAKYLLGRARIRIQLDPQGWFWYGLLIVCLIGLAVILGLVAFGGH